MRVKTLWKANKLTFFCECTEKECQSNRIASINDEFTKFTTEGSNKTFRFWWHKLHCILLTFQDNRMGGGVDERKERRWKSLSKREKLSINSTEWKDGCGDKGMRRRRGGNSSVFLFNPLFVIIPLGKSSILERKRGKGGGRGRPEGIWSD